MSREKRRQLGTETLEILEKRELPYSPLFGEAVEKSILSSRLLLQSDKTKWIGQARIQSTPGRVWVLRDTVLSATQWVWQQSGSVPFVLNFGSGTRPGGGFLSGGNTQEESIVRSSALYPCLLKHEDSFYEYHKNLPDRDRAWYSGRMILAEKVPVFRDSHSNILHTWYPCDILTACAVNRTALISNRLQHNEQEVYEVMYKRVMRVLEAAYQKRPKTLILGAWGCGVFGLEPDRMAETFDRALRYWDFSTVIFAIPDVRTFEVFLARFEKNRDAEIKWRESDPR